MNQDLQKICDILEEISLIPHQEDTIIGGALDSVELVDLECELEEAFLLDLAPNLLELSDTPRTIYNKIFNIY